MRKAKDLNELIDLVHEAVYEVDELRACLEHDDEEASTYTPYLNTLDTMLLATEFPMERGQIEALRSFALARLNRIPEAHKAIEAGVDGLVVEGGEHGVEVYMI